MNLHAMLDNACVSRHPDRSARAIESLPLEDQLTELDTLEIQPLVTLLDFLSPNQAGDIFAALHPGRRSSVLELASPRLSVLLLLIPYKP